VYTSQVTRSQIEQFQQQLYSDVDYVIYPMKDPAVSKQEYMDAKQGSLIAHAAAMRYPYQQLAYPPPPYPSYRAGPKSHLIYRSTPNVAVASGYLPVALGSSSIQSASSSPIKYASNQNLSSVEPLSGYASFSPSSYLSASHYSSPASPLYSAGTSYSSSSTKSLRYEPPVPPFSSSVADLRHVNVSKILPSPTAQSPLGGFGRAHSDDNILNSYEKPNNGQHLLERPKYRRLPPPPPPPPYDRQVSTTSCFLWLQLIYERQL
jgi:protein expanded